MEYTIFILVLPLAMFLLLGLLDSKLKPRVAGILGTLGMTVCAALAYLTAFQFFTQPRNAEGVIPSQVPYNFEWLRFTENFHISNDACRHHYRIVDGTYL